MEPTVAEILTRECVVLSPAAAVAEALRLAEARRVTHVFVEEAGALVGVSCLCELRKSAPEAQLSKVVGTAARAVDGRTPVRQAWEILRASGSGCLPVKVEGKLAGCVTRGDLADVLSAQPLVRCAACGGYHAPSAPGSEGEGTFCPRCEAGGRTRLGGAG